MGGGRNARLNVAFLRLLAAAVTVRSGNVSLHVGWVIKQSKQTRQTGRGGPGRNRGEAGKQPDAEEENKNNLKHSNSVLHLHSLLLGDWI